MLVGTGDLVTGPAGEQGYATHECPARSKNMNFHQALDLKIF